MLISLGTMKSFALVSHPLNSVHLTFADSSPPFLEKKILIMLREKNLVKESYGDMVSANITIL